MNNIDKGPAAIWVTKRRAESKHNVKRAQKQEIRKAHTTMRKSAQQHRPRDPLQSALCLQWVLSMHAEHVCTASDRTCNNQPNPHLYAFYGHYRHVVEVLGDVVNVCKCFELLLMPYQKISFIFISIQNFSYGLVRITQTSTSKRCSLARTAITRIVITRTYSGGGKRDKQVQHHTSSSRQSGSFNTRA